MSLRQAGTRTCLKCWLGPLQKLMICSISSIMKGSGLIDQLLWLCWITGGLCVSLGLFMFDELFSPHVLKNFFRQHWPYSDSYFYCWSKEGFAGLASICCKLKYRVFKLRPKLHLMAHILNLCSTSCMHKQNLHIDSFYFQWTKDTIARTVRTRKWKNPISTQWFGCIAFEILI